MLKALNSVVERLSSEGVFTEEDAMRMMHYLLATRVA
jgi:hypothetical protein